LAFLSVVGLFAVGPAEANHCFAGQPCPKLFPGPHPSADKGYYWVCDWPDGLHYRCHSARADPPVDQCTTDGSVIAVEDQRLGEAVDVVGTPFSLHYQSDRQVGRDATAYNAPFDARQLDTSIYRLFGRG
jgi:hypothetical protein